MATKMVKPDSRLHITAFANETEFNVRFDAEPNNIFIRSTVGNEDMRDLVEYLKTNTEHGFGVSEKIQKRVINWVMENTPDTTYYITLDFKTPNGDFSRYYLMGLYGEVVKYGGPAMKKIYVNRRSAIKAAKNAKELYPHAQISVFQYRISDASLETICEL